MIGCGRNIISLAWLLTCVVNAGIHDERLVAAESYSLFVRQFMALLVRACARIVWLTTSAAQTDAAFQNSWHLRAQNARVTAEMPAYVNIIDVFNASHSSFGALQSRGQRPHECEVLCDASAHLHPCAQCHTSQNLNHATAPITY